MCKMQENTRTVSRILHIFDPTLAFYTDPIIIENNWNLQKITENLLTDARAALTE